MNGKKVRPDFKLRPTVEELAELRRRAEASGKSLNRYLIERGLSAVDTKCAAEASQSELREQAVFELRRAGYDLNKLIKRGSTEASAAVKSAMAELVKAAQMLGSAEKPGG